MESWIFSTYFQITLQNFYIGENIKKILQGEIKEEGK